MWNVVNKLTLLELVRNSAGGASLAARYTRFTPRYPACRLDHMLLYAFEIPNTLAYYEQALMVITDHVLSTIMCLIDSMSILSLIDLVSLFTTRRHNRIYANWVV